MQVAICRRCGIGRRASWTMQIQQSRQPCNRAQQLPPPKQPPDPAAAPESCCPCAFSGGASLTAIGSDQQMLRLHVPPFSGAYAIVAQALI